MYTIPRGEDEYSSLVSPRTAYSLSTDLYQNDSNELFVNYGTVSSSQRDKNPKSENK